MDWWLEFFRAFGWWRIIVILLVCAVILTGAVYGVHAIRELILKWWFS